MGPIATRRLLLRLRRHLLGVFAVCVMAVVVAMHHTELPLPMGDVAGTSGMASMVHHGSAGHDDGHAAADMAACVAAFAAIGAGVVATVLGSVVLAWRLGEGPGALRTGLASQSRTNPSGVGPDPPGLCVWRI